MDQFQEWLSGQNVAGLALIALGVLVAIKAAKAVVKLAMVAVVVIGGYLLFAG